jgi:glucokinase
MSRNTNHPAPAPLAGRILAADIGGTHSRFALFHLHPGEGGILSLALERRVVFRTHEHKNATELLSRLRHDADEPALLGPDAPPLLAAVLAIPAPTGGKDPFAAPDRDECCPCPNIPWPIRWAEAKAALGTDALRLTNDFAAQGFACGALPQALDALAVLPGTPVPGAPVALMGAGTGFGQCLILPGPSPAVFPSEGGHSLFPFAGAEEFRYAAFVRATRPDAPLDRKSVV